MNILETVKFRLKSGITKADFIAANEELQAWVVDQPGFKQRMLTCSEDEWLDCVVWQDKQSAERAMQAFMTEMCSTPFIKAIDETSVEVSHREIVA